MVPEPHLDRLPIIGVAVSRDDRVSHQLAGDRARKLIPQSGAPNLPREDIKTCRIVEVGRIGVGGKRKRHDIRHPGMASAPA